MISIALSIGLVASLVDPQVLLAIFSRTQAGAGGFEDGVSTSRRVAA